MKIELDVPQELMESIKNQIAEYEKENQKPKDVIDYENGWIIEKESCLSNPFVLQTHHRSSDYVKYCYNIGLYRDTQEEAEKLLCKMQIEHRLRQWAKMCDRKIEYFNTNQKKFYAYINSNFEICIYTILFAYRNDIYFTDESILQRAIEDIGEQNLIDNYFVEV